MSSNNTSLSKLDEIRHLLKYGEQGNKVMPYGARGRAAILCNELFGYGWFLRDSSSIEWRQARDLIRTIFNDALGERIKSNPSVHWKRFQEYGRGHFIGTILGS